MNIWVVSREYAGIAEAGGVKNVTCSLSESLAASGHKVTVFIPLYACTDISRIASFSCVWHSPVTINVDSKEILVTYSHGFLGNVEFVFIGNRSFSEKKSVYTYTQEDEDKDASHKKGNGYTDANFLNVFFQKAVVAYGMTCSENECPDIIHCQDATAALVPAFIADISLNSCALNKFYRGTKSVITIHNAGPGYRHEFSSVEEAKKYTMLSTELLSEGLVSGRVEPFLLSAGHAVLTTVSTEYAQEILSGKAETQGLGEAFSRRGIKIHGITNGIDFERYDPSDSKKSGLPFTFNPSEGDFLGKYKNRAWFLEHYAEKEVCFMTKGVEKIGFLQADSGENIYIVSHSRIVHQKGIDVMENAAAQILQGDSRVRFIFMGQGEPSLEKLLESLALRFEGRCVYFRGYDKMLSRLCIASADFSVHSSYFEPCGLEDFIAQIYGTIPVANATGGLCKIKDKETGFLYSPNTGAVLAGLLRGLCVKDFSSHAEYDSIRRNAAFTVKEKFNWMYITEKYYIPLYSAISAGTECE